ncbi:retrovirus-related pol polyprotein from transposon TNT 1-94 [Tanacetum coccineum]
MHQHMTGNLKLLCNFIEKYLGSVRFGNDQFSPILGYGDLVQGNITIKEGNDLISGNRGSDLYTISLQDTTSPTPICFMAKASPTQAWLWHRRLSHLNFDTINLLSKKDIFIGLPKLKYVKDQLCGLNLLHMDLCGLMRIESINGKKYILSKGYKVYNKRTRLIVESIHINFDEINECHRRSNCVLAFALQLQKTSDHNRSELETHDHINEPSSSKLVPNVSPSANTTVPSLQELDLFYNPLYDEFFTTRNSSILESSSPSDNSQQQDMPPISNVHTTIEPITPTTTINAEENNNDIQAENA